MAGSPRSVDAATLNYRILLACISFCRPERERPALLTLERCHHRRRQLRSQHLRANERPVYISFRTGKVSSAKVSKGVLNWRLQRAKHMLSLDHIPSSSVVVSSPAAALRRDLGSDPGRWHTSTSWFTFFGTPNRRSFENVHAKGWLVWRARARTLAVD